VARQRALGPRFRKGTAPPRRAVRGFADIVQTARDIGGHHVIVSIRAASSSAA